MSPSRWLLLALALLLPGTSAFAQRMVVQRIKPALLVVDVQNAFLPSMAEADQKAAPEGINMAISLFHRFNQPVIRVYHTDPNVGPKPDTKGFEFPDTIQVKSEDLKVIKTFGNAFKKTELDKLLKEKGVNTVFICGLSATGCVLATYHGAEDLDYNVFMIKGGLLSPKASQTETIEEICDSVNWKALLVMLAGTLPDPDKVKPLCYRDAASVVEECRQLRTAHPEDPDFTEGGLNDWAYRVLALGYREAAIGMFRLNAEYNPQSSNCLDSLAEALAGAGDGAKALEAYRKAIELLDRFPERNKGYAPARQATLEKIRQLENGQATPSSR
jgi:nicotinamidase-related amidase